MPDAILVLGGGVRDGGELPEWALRRLDRARQLHSGEFLILLSAGTTHRPPPLDSHGFPIYESVAGARYLAATGVPQDLILTETHSYDTIGNAFFARVIHTDPMGLRDLLVVTSEFHMARSKAIFDWMFALQPNPGYRLSYESVSDDGLDPAAHQVRTEKEARSLQGFRESWLSITSLAEAHHRMFTRHGAYSATRPAFRQPTPPELLGLY